MGTLVRRVLLVEDDARMRETIQALLERAGFRVSAARDGAEAWEQLGRGPRPFAILADLYTPRMTGHDLVARIRRTPRLAGIPVIAMSGGGLCGPRGQLGVECLGYPMYLRVLALHHADDWLHIRVNALVQSRP